MTRTRIKICGITNPEDAANAIAAGADALGFNFYKKSVRYIDPACARDIVTSLPPFVTRVGLFVNESQKVISETLSVVSLDLLQFHGDETPSACEALGVPYIKVLKANSLKEIKQAAAGYTSATALMIDTVAGGNFGGTGEVFDWAMIPHLEKPLVLAGGLDADNVGQAVRSVRPYAVDVSSGVELEKGKKDMDRMLAFTGAVLEADREQS